MDPSIGSMARRPANPQRHPGVDKASSVRLLVCGHGTQLLSANFLAVFT